MVRRYVRYSPGVSPIFFAYSIHHPYIPAAVCLRLSHNHLELSQIWLSLSPTMTFGVLAVLSPLHLRCFIDHPFGIEDQSRMEMGSNLQKELAERR